MNLALIFRYVHALIISIENNSALNFAESVEGVSHDQFTRILHKSGQWLRVLLAFVTKSALGKGYLILDDTILEKYTQGLKCIFKLKDSKTGHYVYGLNIVLLCWSDGTGLLAFLYLDSLKTKYKASHYKLRKRCISRKIVVSTHDIAAFFAAA